MVSIPTIAGLIARPQQPVMLPDPIQGFMQGRQDRQQLQTQDALRNGLPRAPDGSIDFRRAADILAQSGQLGPAIGAAQQQQQMMLGQQAARDFATAMGGGGAPAGPAATPTQLPGPPRPNVAGTGAPAAAGAAPPVMPSARWWGDAEAEAAGLLEPRTPAAAPAAPAAPTPQAAAPVAPSGPGIPPMERLLPAMLNQHLPKAYRDLAEKMFDHQLKQQGSTESVRSLDQRAQRAGLRPGTKEYNDFMINGGKPPGTTVNVNTAEGFGAAQTKARIAVDTVGATAAAKLALDGARLSPLLDTVERLADKTPGGWAGPVTATLARAAGAIGIEVPPGWNNSELLQTISQRLIPIVREPGPTSEKEMGMYLQAVPGLMQTPEGRRKVVAMSRAMADRAREIAKVYRTHIGSPDLYDRLAELDKPIIPPAIRQAVEAEANAGQQNRSGSTSGGVRWRLAD